VQVGYKYSGLSVPLTWILLLSSAVMLNPVCALPIMNEQTRGGIPVYSSNDTECALVAEARNKYNTA